LYLIEKNTKQKKKFLFYFFSNEQNRLSNSDIFLLLLNNTSRLLRTQFQVHGNNLSSTMAHIYKTKSDSNFNQNLTGSEINLTDDIQIAQARRVENFLYHFLILFLYIIGTIITCRSCRRINRRK
jgi:hypothetical protein